MTLAEFLAALPYLVSSLSVIVAASAHYRISVKNSVATLASVIKATEATVAATEDNTVVTAPQPIQPSSSTMHPDARDLLQKRISEASGGAGWRTLYQQRAAASK